jgi:serine/threonine protein kinase
MKKSIRKALHGGDIRIPKDVPCGSFGCFYTHDRIQELQETLSPIIQNDGSVQISYLNGKKNWSIKFETDILNSFMNEVDKNQLGLRIEGLYNDYAVDEQVNVIGYVQNAYNTREDIIKYTTYYPLDLDTYEDSKNIFFILIILEKPIKYQFKRKEMKLQYIMLTPQQPCKMDLFHYFIASLHDEYYEISEKQYITEFIQSMKQIKESLKKLHDKKIYHCDVKLENMVKCAGMSKLIDFPTNNTDVKYKLKDLPKFSKTAYTWAFNSQLSGFNKLRYDIKKKIKKFRGEEINKEDGVMYDKISMNLIFIYVTHTASSYFDIPMDVAISKIYKRLHYPEASQMIIDKKIVLKSATPNHQFIFKLIRLYKSEIMKMNSRAQNTNNNSTQNSSGEYSHQNSKATHYSNAIQNSPDYENAPITKFNAAVFAIDNIIYEEDEEKDGNSNMTDNPLFEHKNNNSYKSFSGGRSKISKKKI